MTEPQNNTAAIKALVKAQSEMGRAMKDTANPFFNSKYADLTSVQDACMPALQKNGFAVMHHIEGSTGTHSYVCTRLLHESGAEWACSIPLLVDKQNMQGLGSAITYARRYGLMCLSGVAPEDDDGNKAAANPPKREQPKQTPFDDGPPPADPGPPQNGRFEENVAREIAKIATINDIDELKSYWLALSKAQVAVALDDRVVKAKDDIKAVILNVEGG